MGRYKDYNREPKRGGYGDDQSSGDGASRGRPNSSSPTASLASEPVEVIVKRFYPEKGFGFVAMVGGSDAFLHIRQLEAAGHISVPEGAHIKVRIGQGQKGPEVTEVIEVHLDGIVVGTSPEGRPATPAQVSCQTNESIGTVKMYKADKGFGFISQDGGGRMCLSTPRHFVAAGCASLPKVSVCGCKSARVKKGSRLRRSNSWTSCTSP